MPEGVRISQEQSDQIQAHLAHVASQQAQQDMQYLRDNDIVPTPALLEEIASRRANLARASLSAELDLRVSNGMTPEQALSDYLATRCDNPVVQTSDTHDLDNENTLITDRKDRPLMARQYARVQRARRFIQQHSAIPKILVGLLLLLFFIIGSILHIMTSEAFFLGGDATGLLGANWQILLQPVQLATGTLPGGMSMQKAVMWGWGIELVFLICIIGHDRLHRNVRASSRAMAKLFRVGTVLLVFFDGWADFNYGNTGGGFWAQLGFTLIVGFVVFYFGTGGFHLVAEGLTELAEDLKEDDDYDELY